MSPRALSVLLSVGLVSACAAKNPDSKAGSTDESADGGDEGDGSDGSDGGDGGDGGDIEPLMFEMTAPSSGAFLVDSSVEARGSWSGGQNGWAAVNGVDVGAAGEFSLSSSHGDTTWPSSPLWPVLGEAQDDSGQWIRARSTLIQGESVPTDTPMPSGLVLRLTDELLVDLGPQIDEIVGGLDLNELLGTSDPIWSDFGLSVYLVGAEIGAITADLDFQRSGLNYALEAAPLTIDLDIDAGILGSYPTEVSVETLQVTGDMVIGVSGGGLAVTPANTEVSTTGLEVFGFEDSFGIIDLLLADTLSSAVEEQLIGALDGLLEAQESIRVLDFEGLQILSDFTSAVHDDGGINIYAESTISTVDDSVALGERLTTSGSFSAPTDSTSPAGVPYQAALLLDDDLLSAIGAALPATGLLDQTVEGDALGSISLDTTLLGGLVPGFDQLPPGQPVTLQTRPTVPLVGAPGADGIAAELHLGGLLIDFLTDQDGDGADDVVMTVAIDAIVGITAGEEGALIGIEVLDTQSTVLSTTFPADPVEVDTGLDTLISLAVPALVGGLLGDALSFDLGGIDITVVDGGAVADRAGLYLELDLSGLEL